jgi:hypothetical protein
LIAAAVVTSTIFGAAEGASFLTFAFEPPQDTAKTAMATNAATDNASFTLPGSGIVFTIP